MGLVIKTQGTTAPEGAEKLYRDALVGEGTLFLQDFSNRGTLYNFRLNNGDPVYDLAREVSIPMGMNNSITFKHNLEEGNPELTEGKGFRVDNLGRNPGSAENLGIDLGTDLLEALSERTGGVLLVTWCRINPEATGSGAFVTSTGNGGGNNYPIRFYGSSFGGGFINISFAGAAGGGAPEDYADGKLVQVALEYIGEGIPNNIYINGSFSGASTNVAASFGDPDSNLVLGKIDTINRSGIMYRWFIEDLNISGRTAEDVVQKDWDYCHGTGEYTGLPTRRPFIDAL